MLGLVVVHRFNFSAPGPGVGCTAVNRKLGEAGINARAHPRLGGNRGRAAQDARAIKVPGEEICQTETREGLSQRLETDRDRPRQTRRG